MFWIDSVNKAPKRLNFKKINPGYELMIDGLLSENKLILKPNESYVIQKWGSGGVPFKIKIWVDSKGDVNKTSHPYCGIESLSLSG